MLTIVWIRADLRGVVISDASKRELERVLLAGEDARVGDRTLLLPHASDAETAWELACGTLVALLSLGVAFAIVTGPAVADDELDASRGGLG